MARNGVHTTFVDELGVEIEKGLSTLVVEPRVIDLFGLDWVFELRANFADKHGANLRNTLAHGLIGDESDGSLTMFYAWWLALRLAVTALVARRKPLRHRRNVHRRRRRD